MQSQVPFTVPHTHSVYNTSGCMLKWVKLHIYIFIIEVEMLMWSLLMIVLNIFIHSSYHDNVQSTSFTTRLEGYDKSLKRGAFWNSLESKRAAMPFQKHNYIYTHEPFFSRDAKFHVPESLPLQANNSCSWPDEDCVSVTELSNCDFRVMIYYDFMRG